MTRLAWLTAILIPVSAWGQVYLIAGTPTPKWNYKFAAGLFRVERDGKVSSVADLALQPGGIEWIAVSNDLRKAVILPATEVRVVVVDLDEAAIAKQCSLPWGKGSLVNQWLSSVPGRGQMFELTTVMSDAPAGTVGHTREEVRGMLLDPAIPCGESFPPSSAADAKYITVQGSAGVGGTTTGEGEYAYVEPDGRVTALVFGVRSYFDVSDIPVGLRKNIDSAWVSINDLHVFAIESSDHSQEIRQLLAFRKRDKTWHLIPPSFKRSIVRGFENFIVGTEVANLDPKLFSVENDDHGGGQSPGRSEWRQQASTYGPSMLESFQATTIVFPGRLHLYNMETERVFTIETKQGDSEILLVEKNTVYYRVTDRLYSAPITDKGIGTAKLIATDDIIRDSHWAFIKH